MSAKKLRQTCQTVMRKVLLLKEDCHRLNCDYSLGGVMGSVLMCIFSVDQYIQ